MFWRTEVVGIPFCSHCGTALADGAKFCSECGRPTGVPTSDAESAIPVRVVNDPEIADFGAQFPYPGPVPSKVKWGANFLDRIIALGVVAGRPKDEIVGFLGPPTSTSAAASGCQLLQWMTTSAWGRSWHYALIFDSNGICGGITHEWVG